MPGIVEYRYDHSSDYKTIRTSGKGRPINSKDVTLKGLYSEMFPITINKKKNSLLQLCLKGIPIELYAWYKSLSTSKRAVDEIPALGVDSDTDET